MTSFGKRCHMMDSHYSSSSWKLNFINVPDIHIKVFSILMGKRFRQILDDAGRRQ